MVKEVKDEMFNSQDNTKLNRTLHVSSNEISKYLRNEKHSLFILYKIFYIITKVEGDF